MRRLLVIEDEQDSLEMLLLVLEQGGYSVVGADSAADGMYRLATQTFDLVLTDLVLDRRGIDESWRVLDQLMDLARPALFGLMTAWEVRDADLPRHRVDFVLRKPCTRDVLFEQLAASLHLPDVPDDKVDVVRNYFSRLEQREFDALADLCTDAVLYKLPGDHPQFANEVRGRNELVAFAQRTFEDFPDAHFEIKSIRPLPSGALVEYRGRWRDGTDERAVPGGIMFEFCDNLISQIQVRVPVEQLA